MQTKGNLTSCRGNSDKSEHCFYSSYLNFFTAELLENAVVATMEKHIFSSQANVDVSGPDGSQLMMVDRFISQLFHPLIHAGYGLEFGFLGLVAEGKFQHYPMSNNNVVHFI